MTHQETGTLKVVPLRSLGWGMSGVFRQRLHEARSLINLGVTPSLVDLPHLVLESCSSPEGPVNSYTTSEASEAELTNDLLQIGNSCIMSGP